MTSYRELYSPIMCCETDIDIIQCFAIAVDAYMSEFGFSISKAHSKVLTDMNYYSGYYETPRRKHVMSILNNMRSEYIQDEILRLSHDMLRDV